MDRALRQLESEAIHIFREASSRFKKPVMLYSVGKDSSVMVHLAQKAFCPEKLPFPLMHIDTGFKFPEMYAFRDAFCRDHELELIVERNEEWIENGCNPDELGRDACCAHLKTEALIAALESHGFDAAFGGARREEEKSRAKERVFSVRDQYGQWNPKMQRPEIWDLYNAELTHGQSMRIFPMSNWTELDVWRYIEAEGIPVVPLYFAEMRLQQDKEAGREAMCRYRSLGCIQCSGSVPSEAKTAMEIIEELKSSKYSERQTRLIDLTSDAAMEEKKKQGYF